MKQSYKMIAPNQKEHKTQHGLYFSNSLITIKYILSDNGSEFEGEFDNLPKERKIQHYWTYPKSQR